MELIREKNEGAAVITLGHVHACASARVCVYELALVSAVHVACCELSVCVSSVVLSS